MDDPDRPAAILSPSPSPSNLNLASSFDSLPSSPPPPLQPSQPLDTDAASLPPLRRPDPPKKGILKPPKQAQKGVFASLISRQPRDLVGSLGARLMGEPAPSSTAPSDSSDSKVNQQQKTGRNLAQGTSPTGGTFFSKAFGKLNIAASATLGNISSSSTASDASAQSPASPTASSDTTEPRGPEPVLFLKRASFHLPSITITYPITSSLPPYSESVTKSIEQVETSYLAKLQEEEGWEFWSSQKLLDLYEKACRARDEGIDERIWRGLKAAGAVVSPSPRVLDLTGVYLSRFTADALSDVLAMEWGLSQLVLDECDLADDALKCILHALLYPRSLSSLSLRSNRRLKLSGWKILSIYLKQAQAHSLRYLNLSDNPLDKKSVDALAEGIICPKEGLKDQTEVGARSTSVKEEERNESASRFEGKNGIKESESENKNEGRSVSLLKEREMKRSQSLRDDRLGKGERKGLDTIRLDGCSLRANAVESLAQAVRSSNIRNVSLRRNKINNLGGVGIALMIKDYPDTITPNVSNPFGTPSSSDASSPSNTNGPQVPSTTYTAYTPRSRRKLEDLTMGGDSLPSIPLVVSNSRGGITSRLLPNGYSAPAASTEQEEESANGTPNGEAGPDGLGAARMGAGMMHSRVRRLDDVERIGNLVTLDLKGNDLRGGVTYIAQVLKRNRTLKICNLADNKVDVLGLAALAEALKYNSTLETLDLSHNPCSGPGLEGINGLRMSFTLNTSLKRLFLADTGLATEGAIALAEFLPETEHLLHLDLTKNQGIEVAGIMALAVGLRSNRVMRCLDLSIPFNNSDVASLSQDILQSCIRNTELAQEKTTSKASRAAVWGPIQKSTLARIAKEADSARALATVQSSASTPAGKARAAIFELSPEMIVTAAEESVQSLDETVEVHNTLGVVLEEAVGLIERARALRERLQEIVQELAAAEETKEDQSADRLQVLLGLIDRLSTQLSRAEKAKAACDEKNARLEAFKTKGPALKDLTLEIPSTPPSHQARSMPKETLMSPNFSIAGDSEDESEPEMNGFTFPVMPPKPTTPPTDPENVVEKPACASPTDRKRTSWVEEEGEVFRKGVVLGAAEVDEDGTEPISGDQLKKELLETPVERPARQTSSEDNPLVID